MQKQSYEKPNGWSETVSGVSGRLRLEFEDLEPGLRHAVYLELMNHSLNPVMLTNQPGINAQLFESGKPVDTSGQVGNGPEPIRQWALLPRDAYLGFRIDMQDIGIPTREHGVVLLAIGGKAWELRLGKYLLKVSVDFKAEPDGPANQWVGKLSLPQVEVVVRPEMVTTQ